VLFFVGGNEWSEFAIWVMQPPYMKYSDNKQLLVFKKISPYFELRNLRNKTKTLRTQTSKS